MTDDATPQYTLEQIKAMSPEQVKEMSLDEFGDALKVAMTGTEPAEPIEGVHHRVEGTAGQATVAFGNVFFNPDIPDRNRGGGPRDEPYDPDNEE